MKDTLLKVKARLDSQLDYLPMKDGTERAIFITTESVIPEVADFPAIGIKDGPVSYELASGTMNGAADFVVSLLIKVTVFVRLYRTEEIITGDGTEKGVLEVAADVKDALLGWNPDPDNGMPLLIEAEGESQILSDDTVLIQAKELTFKHLKQVSI